MIVWLGVIIGLCEGFIVGLLNTVLYFGNNLWFYMVHPLRAFNIFELYNSVFGPLQIYYAEVGDRTVQALGPIYRHTVAGPREIARIVGEHSGGALVLLALYLMIRFIGRKTYAYLKNRN